MQVPTSTIRRSSDNCGRANKAASDALSSPLISNVKGSVSWQNLEPVNANVISIKQADKMSPKLFGNIFLGFIKLFGSKCRPRFLA